MPLCNIRKFFASRCSLDIFCVAAAANLLPLSATGGGRSRNPTSNARRTHNPKGLRGGTRSETIKKWIPEWVSIFYGCGGRT